MATPAEIIAEAGCTVCSGATTMFQTLAISMLKQITGMTQAEVEAESPCWICYGLSQAEAAMLVLLNNLSGGGSGTGGAGSVGNGSPEGVVTAEPGTTYYDLVQPALWYKTSGSGNTGWTNTMP